MKTLEPRALRFTRDDYYRMAAAGVLDGHRVELMRGEVVEMSPQDPLHAGAVTMAYEALRRAFKKGFAIRMQMPLVLGRDSVPEPDVAVVRGTARDQSRGHPKSAVLVLEVSLTSLDYDRATKGRLYAEAGIAEYWIVNLADGVVEVYRNPRREEGRARRFGYSSMDRVSPGRSIAPLAAPRARVKAEDLVP